MSVRWIESALNGLWQGMALAGVMAVVMRVAGRRFAPRGRHALWWLTLLAVALLPLLPRAPLRPAAERVVGADAGGAAREEPVRSGAPAATVDRLQVAGEPVESDGPATPPAAVDAGLVPAARGGSLTLPSAIPAVAVIAWGLVALVLLARLAWGFRLARRLRAGMRLPDGAVRARIAALRAASGVRRPVRIGVTDELAVPATLGLARPVVLIPAALEKSLDPADLDRIVLHELAHVARRDDWTALAERVIASLLFFQPAAAWIGRRIALEREHACDEWVIARRAGRAEYARCLLRVGEHAVAARAQLPAGALSMASRLSERVGRVLGPDPARPRRRLVFCTAAALPLILTAATAAAPRLRMETHRAVSAAAFATADGSGGAALRTDALMRRLEEYGLHGAVLIARGDDVLLRSGYGLADRAAGIPFDAATPFNGGAFAKLLTAAAVMKLQEQGRLNVAHPVARYLGPFPAPKSDVTIHQLLTHTAGLARAWAPIYRADRDAFVQAMKDTPAEYAAGAGHRYTDHGHALLAAVIEVVSGQTYESFVRASLLDPAGMESTRFESEPAPDDVAMAAEYVHPAGSDSRITERAYVWGRRGAMGVITTLDDLWRFHRAFEDGLLLGEPARQAMLTGYTDAGRFTRIGYGWEVGTTARGTTIRHRLSAWNSSSVEIAYDEDEDLFVALVANAPTNWASPKYLDLLDAALGRSHFRPQAPHVPVLPPAVHAGSYTLPSGATIDVIAEGDDRIRLHTTDARAARALTHQTARGATVIARADGKHSYAVAQWHRHAVLDLAFDAATGTMTVDGLGRAVRSGPAPPAQ